MESPTTQTTQLGPDRRFLNAKGQTTYGAPAVWSQLLENNDEKFVSMGLGSTYIGVFFHSDPSFSPSPSPPFPFFPHKPQTSKITQPYKPLTILKSLSTTAQMSLLSILGFKCNAVNFFCCTWHITRTPERTKAREAPITTQPTPQEPMSAKPRGSEGRGFAGVSLVFKGAQDYVNP
ncbi:hypothetical protein B9Z19DRAFT_1060674 [Tuber borchii]|uniref:Uncharacterized protein n=1 Tax=Tuber borchii TaxID=42251 RepID=A0A2T7A863_TUBBO|nr:hypothetical protein B9Z19DRAFT_1060674 [Tuber borchii]